MYTGSASAARPARNDGARNPIISLPAEGTDTRSTPHPEACPLPTSGNPVPQNASSRAFVVDAPRSSGDPGPSHTPESPPAAVPSPYRRESKARVTQAVSPSDPARETESLHFHESA